MKKKNKNNRIKTTHTINATNYNTQQQKIKTFIRLMQL